MDVAWLFSGPEIGQKKQKVSDIKKEVAKKYGEPEAHLFYAYETTVYEVLTILQSTSLFSAPTFVEFRNAELIKDKAEIEALKNWMQKATSDDLSFLLLETDEFSADKKLDALFDTGQKQVFWELFENKKQDWIRNFFSANGMSITAEGIEAILGLVENNTEALKNECQHLVLFFDKGKKITDSDIESLLSHNKDEDVFSLFDALTQNNTEKTFDILSKLLVSKNFSAAQFLIGLSFCFRKLYDIQHYLAEKGESPTPAALRNFGVVSKKALAQNTRALRLWTETELANIVLLLNQCDLAVRSHGQALQNTLLETAILKIAKKDLKKHKY